MEPTFTKKEKKRQHNVVRCPKCGADNLELQYRCGRCGYSFKAPEKDFGPRMELGEQPETLGAKVLCPACGAENDILAHFCAKCGLPLRK